MENPSFYLEGVVREKNELQDFEGPLSLILMLLSKNKIEIRDIKISEILDQYLEYLDQMQKLDLEIASEFVQMASHLLYIKTKTLLTQEEEVSELEVLIASLEQLKSRDTLSAVKQVIPQLKEASELGLLYFSKLPEPQAGIEAVAVDTVVLTGNTTMLYLLTGRDVDCLSHAPFLADELFGRYAEPEELTQAVPKRIVYSVRDKSRQIIDLLRRGSVYLTELYSTCRSRSEVVATFISVLELCSMGSIHIDRADEGYSLSFTGGDVDEIIEKIVE